MTLHDPIWQQNLTYTAQEDRSLIDALMSAGVGGVTGLKVTERGAGANMSVDVAAGTVAIVGTDAAEQGTYVCISDAVVNVPLSASPSSGNSRIDLIVATVRDAAVTGADNDWIITKVDGTPSSGTPAVPTTPTSSVVLAQVLVAGLAASIVNANITDKRTLAGSMLSYAADTSVPPSFDGQIIGTSASAAYIADSGLWMPISTPGVKSTSANLSNVNFGGSVWGTWSGTPITVTAPGYPVRCQINFQCSISTNFGQFRLGLSGNGGSSWTTSPVVGAAATSALDVRLVSMTWQATYTGSGDIQARVEGNGGGSGGVPTSGGFLSLTCWPT